ncbi:unnamed protein product [Rotaria socialis]|uniref:5'-3' exoribonuclease n=1 Tax=Rotaria socialis TaxID=392032 RepID=A0A818W3M2_9BILA|nr:unnamed protein product [Rotaria socialis]CAF4572606.1 unnamed protein product [Rotaria socialis]
MGVPAFFRWLTKKYPSIIVNCIEDNPSTDAQGVYHPLDETRANPNGIEFDNLYLDMNGIIHPCTHPEDRPPPKNEDEMMILIFECIDRLFSIVRPRKLLYMAIDGVAPRAKMNQQRSRRFRASKETVDKVEQMEKIKNEIRTSGGLLPEDKSHQEKSEHFDSNCITPGTPFMSKLADCLRYYIRHRMNTNPAWRSIKVILSDANVPGEGEHKIMDYIRRQRAQPDHDPNTHHVLCGADADLIMLGLATHEPYFTIIREEFKPNKPRPCDICGQLGHEMKECKGIAKEKFGTHDELTAPKNYGETRYIFVRLSILREYLYRDLEIRFQLPFEWDLERAIDDWVFMCFFVGNDFLPHLPSLEIREGAIDRLIRIYKDNVPKFQGYLTENGIPNMERVEIILTSIGRMEDEIFMKRHESDQQQRQRERSRSNNYQSPNKRHRATTERNGPAPLPVWMAAPQLEPQPIGQRPNTHISNPAQANSQLRQMQRVDFSSSDASNNRPEKRSYDELEQETPDSSRYDQQDSVHDEEEDNDANDSVRLWEEGWRERYYKNKFNVSKNDLEQFRIQVAQHYARGLCWVLQYYYQGVPAWDWYFPYHYAPFASDFHLVRDVPVHFDKKTKPFHPLEQLMAVFPSQSRKFLPIEWQSLMTEKESPIIDFYPLNFCVDLNGKRYEWQGVALLPFVDEKRLHRTLEHVYSTLTIEEGKRNQRDYDRLYIHSTDLCYDYLKQLYVPGITEVTKKSSLNMPTMLSGGLAGCIWPDEDDNIKPIGEEVKAPLPNCEDVINNQVISVKYQDLPFDDDYIFKAKLLENIVMPQTTLKPRDYDQMTPYRPNTGFAQRQQYQRDFAPAQRFIRHSMGSQQTDQQQQPGGFYPQHQQDRCYQQNQSSGGYPSRQHNDGGGGYRPRQSYDGGYRPRQPYDDGYRPRQPYDGGYRPRQPYDGGYRPRQPYDGSYRPRQPNDGSYQQRHQNSYNSYRPNY